MWNVGTPMRSQQWVNMLSKPTVRKAEPLSGNRKDQEANAASRKATGIYKTGQIGQYLRRKAADVVLVHHPKNDVKVTRSGEKLDARTLLSKRNREANRLEYH
jgi:hypothetical protein